MGKLMKKLARLWYYNDFHKPDKGETILNPNGFGYVEYDDQKIKCNKCNKETDTVCTMVEKDYDGDISDMEPGIGLCKGCWSSIPEFEKNVSLDNYEREDNYNKQITLDDYVNEIDDEENQENKYLDELYEKQDKLEEQDRRNKKMKANRIINRLIRKASDYSEKTAEDYANEIKNMSDAKLEGFCDEVFDDVIEDTVHQCKVDAGAYCSDEDVREALKRDILELTGYVIDKIEPEMDENFKSVKKEVENILFKDKQFIEKVEKFLTTTIGWFNN